MQEVLWTGWKKETNCDMMKFPLISQWMGYFLSESKLLLKDTEPVRKVYVLRIYIFPFFFFFF